MTDKERSLKPYWYPMEDGEKNEILPSLHANVKRPDFFTKSIDVAVYLVAGVLSILTLNVLNSIVLLLIQTTTSITKPYENIVSVGIVIILVFSSTLYYFFTKARTVYLVSFATSIPDEKYKTTTDEFTKIVHGTGRFEEEQLEFQNRLSSRTGIGEESYLPEALHRIPITTSMSDAREEVRIVAKSACDQLFAQTKIDPTKDIDFVITNCSLFNPTPSMSAMIMNMYKMKQSCKNYSLAGMGCSAGLVSVDLANDLLQVYPNINILVFSTENLTSNWYGGKEKGIMGGAALLLSNKSKWSSKASMKLITTQRVMHAKHDDSYNCIFQYEDNEGVVGVKIGRELLKCVTRALTLNLNLLMPRVISFKEIFKFGIFFIKQKNGETFQGYCIHAGGRAIVDGIQENLKLTDEDCMPSRATLYRFGNTSSSSVWYEMKFIERINTLKRGDKVWQIAFGSGLKCNSVVWQKIN
ncbi:3-ketoacyl-CoA synthase [Entamoeba marina]